MAGLNLIIGEMGSIIAQHVFAFLEFELRKQTLMDETVMEDVGFREAYFGPKASMLAQNYSVNSAIYPIYYLRWNIDKVVGLTRHCNNADEKGGYYEGIVILRKKDKSCTRRLRVTVSFTVDSSKIEHYLPNVSVFEIDLNKAQPDILRLILASEAEEN